ncbi:MAG: FHA domain-containing protein [Pseudomonadota bacterium]
MQTESPSPEGDLFSLLVPLVAGEDVLFAGDLTVGRHPGNVLVLEAARASKWHACLEWRVDRWYLRDLGSTNGTTLNGRRANGMQPLSEGDVIRFAGSVAYRVARLRPSLDRGGGGLDETANTAAAGAVEILGLELSPLPPEAGLVRLRTGEGELEFTAELPYHLLRLLAERAGEWLADDELKAGLWGRRWDLMHRNTYLELLRVLRRLLPARLIEKERGRTRLALAPELVMVREG